MDIKKILSMVDHTLLSQTATESQIEQICRDGVDYGVASVCIPPCYVSAAKTYTDGQINVCTVIGFPNGYSAASVKLFETENAINNGADEIDMVINLGLLKDKKYSKIESEIKQIKNMCGNKILKVIIETCLLTDEEKINMCKIITDSGADYIKTSTGFSASGAKIEDIKLFSKYIGKNVKIKAAGGIKSFEDAKEFIKCGAKRLGTSRIIKLAKEIKF